MNLSVMYSQLNLKGLSILVVGDVMLDSYWQGGTLRISPEAPVPVVLVDDKSYRAGGAGNVAVNITSLGANCKLIGLIGQDEPGETLIDVLSQNLVDCHFVKKKSVITTTKLRVLSQHQQLIRIDFEEIGQKNYGELVEQKFSEQLENVSMVILSDYGKGLLTDPQIFINQARARDIPVLVDPKRLDFEVYRGAFLLTPNKREFEAVAGEFSNLNELAQKADQLIETHDLGGILITQGENGMTLIMKGQSYQHFPTQAREVYDVTGAGDTVIASLAAGLASGMDVNNAVAMACVSAGIVVGRVGTASVSQQDLANYGVSTETVLNDKILSESQLLIYITKQKQLGKTIAVTNGCFDILHSGHVKYLHQASESADILIVAVNSDNSVRQLKGEMRPVNELNERMEILAGLSSINKIVSFDDSTPERLYCEIQPDVLVKGGDYKVEEIAGRNCAGRVEIIPFVKDKSTSRVLDKIKKL